MDILLLLASIVYILSRVHCIMHTTLVVIEQNYLIIFFCILAVGKMLLNIFYLVVCILEYEY